MVTGDGPLETHPSAPPSPDKAKLQRTCASPSSSVWNHETTSRKKRVRQGEDAPRKAILVTAPDAEHKRELKEQERRLRSTTVSAIQLMTVQSKGVIQKRIKQLKSQVEAQEVQHAQDLSNMQEGFRKESKKEVAQAVNAQLREVERLNALLAQREQELAERSRQQEKVSAEWQHALTETYDAQFREQLAAVQQHYEAQLRTAAEEARRAGEREALEKIKVCLLHL